MSGPWLGLIQLFAKEIGKAGGKRVAADIKIAGALKWTHAQKVAELTEDVGLSPTYIKELVEESNSLEDIELICEYLKKDNGYVGATMKSLYEGMLERIKWIDANEAAKETLRLLKEKGTSLLEMISFDDLA